MFTVLACIALLVGSFIVAALVAPFLLTRTQRQLWSKKQPPTEFIVRGTHKELRTTLQRRSRAFHS